MRDYFWLPWVPLLWPWICLYFCEFGAHFVSLSPKLLVFHPQHFYIHWWTKLLVVQPHFRWHSHLVESRYYQRNLVSWDYIHWKVVLELIDYQRMVSGYRLILINKSLPSSTTSSNFGMVGEIGLEMGSSSREIISKGSSSSVGFSWAMSD